MSDDPVKDMLDLLTPSKREVFDRHVGSCESPIEEIALAALIALGPCVVASADGRIPHPMPWEIIVVPQAKVPPYRVDFALFGPSMKMHILECDGKEFHGDHGKDNERSLFLDGLGLRVHRVSGASLYRDAPAAITPIIDQVKGKS